MNATNFGVLLLIGVLFAKVGARQLERVSKETKFGISLPKTAITKGVGSELSVTSGTYAYDSTYTSTRASNGPTGPDADGYASRYGSTSGTVVADAPETSATTTSGTSGQAISTAAASPTGAIGTGVATGSSGSTGTGTPAVEGEM